MDDSLFISVFIPVYNGENYLRETLLSIQNQSYTYFEVLMVDDSSTDSSLQILNEFAKVDSRFKVFTKENGGMVANSMNFIRPKIRGDYFFYASQDDLFSSDLFEKMVQRQIETDADSILPDMEVFYEKQINNKQIIGLNGNRKVELSGKLASAKQSESNPDFYTITPPKSKPFMI
jgi:glycosyltransferase involved in cell wall biosynthesis